MFEHIDKSLEKLVKDLKKCDEEREKINLEPIISKNLDSLKYKLGKIKF